MNDKILILEPSDYNPEALKIYAETGSVECWSENDTDMEQFSETTVLVCRLGFKINSKFLKKFPDLKYIVSPTTGLNHIDLDFCDKHHVDVISLKGEVKFLDTIRSTSEHTIALILALVRKIVPGARSVIETNIWDRDQFKGRELKSMTIGVIGAGRIGKHVISYAKSFGMNVMVDSMEITDAMIVFCNKKDLFIGSDIVTLHADYRPENRLMIDYSDFKLMIPGSYFVNTARGELVSEKDIIRALDDGILAGAGLDVLSNEQDRDALLKKEIIQYARTHDNVIVTPHLGGCTIDAMHKTELFAAKKLKSLLEN